MNGLRLALALAALSTTVAASAADQPVTLESSRPVARNIAAFPHLAVKPGDAAAARINRALGGADSWADRLAGDCKHYTGWRRTIRVTMRGPRYLSMIASDDWFCGGAYPDTAETALVFDLTTGAPIDWKGLFPPALIGEAATRPGGGVADPILVDSKPLWELYVKLAASPDAKECDGVRAEASGLDTQLQIWPDAAAGGIGIMATEFPHVVKACAPPVVIPLAELRTLGAAPELLDAIEEAHARGWYDKGK